MTTVPLTIRGSGVMLCTSTVGAYVARYSAPGSGSTSWCPVSGMVGGYVVSTNAAFAGRARTFVVKLTVGANVASVSAFVVGVKRYAILATGANVLSVNALVAGVTRWCAVKLTVGAKRDVMRLAGGTVTMRGEAIVG